MRGINHGRDCFGVSTHLINWKPMRPTQWAMTEILAKLYQKPTRKANLTVKIHPQIMSPLKCHVGTRLLAKISRVLWYDTWNVMRSWNGRGPGSRRITRNVDSIAGITSWKFFSIGNNSVKITYGGCFINFYPGATITSRLWPHYFFPLKIHSTTACHRIKKILALIFRVSPRTYSSNHPMPPVFGCFTAVTTYINNSQFTEITR